MKSNTRRTAEQGASRDDEPQISGIHETAEASAAPGFQSILSAMICFLSHEKMCIGCKQYSRDNGKSQYGKVLLIPGIRNRCNHALIERESDSADGRENEKARHEVLRKKLAQIEGNLLRVARGGARGAYFRAGVDKFMSL